MSLREVMEEHRKAEQRARGMSDEDIEDDEITKKASKIYSTLTPKHTLDDLEFDPEIRGQVEEILEDREFAKELQAEDLTPRKFILLHGPTGCGKTSIAHALAAKTGMPLHVVSGAQASSSWVGETEKNLETLMKFSSRRNCVMLIDEFDSFSLSRQRARTSWEITQVNTLLTSMEQFPPKGIFIATTNNPEMIDPAIRGRFDMVMEIPQLSKKQLVKVAEGVLKGRFGIDPVECVTEGKHARGVVKVAHNKLRKAVIERAKKKSRRVH